MFLLFFFNCIYLQMSNYEVRRSEREGGLYNWVKDELSQETGGSLNKGVQNLKCQN
jgi:hypothetical protein